MNNTSRAFILLVIVIVFAPVFAHGDPCDAWSSHINDDAERAAYISACAPQRLLSSERGEWGYSAPHHNRMEGYSERFLSLDPDVSDYQFPSLNLNPLLFVRCRNNHAAVTYITTFGAILDYEHDDTYPVRFRFASDPAPQTGNWQFQEDNDGNARFYLPPELLQRLREEEWFVVEMEMFEGARFYAEYTPAGLDNIMTKLIECQSDE